MSTAYWSKRAPERPSAAAMRPQLASCPATAVLTSGEVATVRAAASASVCDGGPHDGHAHELGGPLAVGGDLARQARRTPAVRAARKSP